MRHRCTQPPFLSAQGFLTAGQSRRGRLNFVLIRALPGITLMGEESIKQLVMPSKKKKFGIRERPFSTRQKNLCYCSLFTAPARQEDLHGVRSHKGQALIRVKPFQQKLGTGTSLYRDYRASARQTGFECSYQEVCQSPTCSGTWTDATKPYQLLRCF